MRTLILVLSMSLLATPPLAGQQTSPAPGQDTGQQTFPAPGQDTPVTPDEQARQDALDADLDAIAGLLAEAERVAAASVDRYVPNSGLRERGDIETPDVLDAISTYKTLLLIPKKIVDVLTSGQIALTGYTVVVSAPPGLEITFEYTNP